MKQHKVSYSNSWLIFTDDLNWSKPKSEKEEKLLRSMLCQQLLFVETSIIPDSWWLSNFQLRRVIENSDLEHALEERYLVPARGDKFGDSGLAGRFKQQLSMEPNRRMANFISEEGHGRFLTRVDQIGGFVVYDSTLMGHFFSSLIGFVSRSPEALDLFGLARVQPDILAIVADREKAGENLTASHLYNLFEHDKTLQDKVMAMARPIYAINAPTNYGYHIALAGDENDRMQQSILSLLAGLSKVIEPQFMLSQDKALDVLVPIHIDDPVFQEAGLLTFDEIAGARSIHFSKLRNSFISYCQGEIGNTVLEDSYKSYQSNLRDYLTRRNARFDIFVAKRVRDVAMLADYSSKFAGGVAAYKALQSGFTDSDPVIINASVSVLAHFVQRMFNEIANLQENNSLSKGNVKLLTRLDVWMGNKRAIRNGRVE